MATMALSLVMTSWRGTSSTCSIMLILCPTESMKGTSQCGPGAMAWANLPSRSRVYSKPCGTITRVLMPMMMTATTNKMTAVVPNSMFLFPSVLCLDGWDHTPRVAETARSCPATWRWQGLFEKMKTPGKPTNEPANQKRAGLDTSKLQVTVSEAPIPEIRVEPDHFDVVSTDVVLVA